jgi:hypothetical protein
MRKHTVADPHFQRFRTLICSENTLVRMTRPDLALHEVSALSQNKPHRLYVEEVVSNMRYSKVPRAPPKDHCAIHMRFPSLERDHFFSDSTVYRKRLGVHHRHRSAARQKTMLAIQPYRLDSLHDRQMKLIALFVRRSTSAEMLRPKHRRQPLISVRF